jgi:hypothetical protein
MVGEGVAPPGHRAGDDEAVAGREQHLFDLDYQVRPPLYNRTDEQAVTGPQLRREWLAVLGFLGADDAKQPER